jgi:AhpD family alkylhydroperoxidase
MSHPRLNWTSIAPKTYRAMIGVNATLAESTLGPILSDLVQTRVSQINGCAFCLDMHVKEAVIHGERPLRLHHLAIWRESPLFTPAERAALALTESLTRLGEQGVPDDVYEEVRMHFSEKETAALIFAVVTINGWNRISIASRNPPGAMDAAMGLTAAGLS